MAFDSHNSGGVIFPSLLFPNTQWSYASVTGQKKSVRYKRALFDSSAYLVRPYDSFDSGSKKRRKSFWPSHDTVLKRTTAAVDDEINWPIDALNHCKYLSRLRGVWKSYNFSGYFSEFRSLFPRTRNIIFIFLPRLSRYIYIYVYIYINKVYWIKKKYKLFLAKRVDVNICVIFVDCEFVKAN